jgi:hypothetical protein
MPLYLESLFAGRKILQSSDQAPFYNSYAYFIEFLSNGTVEQAIVLIDDLNSLSHYAIPIQVR